MKRKFSIFLLAFSILLAISCQEEGRTYDGPKYVEFSPNQFGQVLGEDGLTRKEGKIVGLETFIVQQIAYLTDKEQTVNFRVANMVYYIKSKYMYVTELPSGMSPSEYKEEYTTMQEGVDYSFDGIEGVSFSKQNLTGSVTIGKMESFAYIVTNIIHKSGKTMFIVLENSSDFTANRHSRILKYTAPQP